MFRVLKSMSPLGKMALVIVLAFVVVALIGPILAPHQPGELLLASPFANPGTAGALLGTDYISRDMLSRMLHGARLTVFLSFGTTGLGVLIGIAIGFFAAEIGGRVDAVTFRLVDIAISFPPILLALLVITGLGSSIPVLICTVGFIQAPRVARVARAVAVDIGIQDFVESARARGETTAAIVWREIVPNVLSPLAAEFGLRMAYSVLLLSALSFLGLGTQPPLADWGALVRENMSSLYYGGWAVILPSAAIALYVVSINILVDALGAKRGYVGAVELLK